MGQCVPRSARAPGDPRAPSKILAWMIAAVIVGGPFASGAVGSARADVFGPPTFQGFVTNDGFFFVEIGTSSFGSFSPVNPGSNVFGTGFTLVLFGLTGFNRTVPVQFTEYPGNGQPDLYDNLSVSVPAKTAVLADLTFPVNSHPTRANLTIDGTTEQFTIETPVLLIPLTNLTNGGFDLILLGILSELLLFTLPLIVLARWMTRRALYAPKMKAILWLHGIVLGIAAFVILDFQLVNETVGGWGWFTYPVPISVFLFFWSASLFNRADVVEVLRPYTASGHRLSFDRWEIRVGRNRDGDLVLVGRRWRDWVFGALGHHVVLSPHDAEEHGVEPQGHALVLREFTSAKKPGGGSPVPGAIQRARKAIRWPTPTKSDPAEDFRVRNAQERGEEDPAYVYFVASVNPVSVDWPKVSVHRWKPTEAVYNDEGDLVRPAGKKWALTWPHIVDGKAEIQLASIHYADVVAVAMGWKTVEDVVRVAEQRHLQVYLLKAHMESEVARQVEEKLTAWLDLHTRPGFDLGEDEEEAEVERGRGRGATRPGPGPDRSDEGEDTERP